MEQIFNSLRTLITPELVSLASTKLEEPGSKISAAIPSIYASLLGVLLKKGNSPQMKNTLDEAGNLNILSDLGAICGETPTQDQQKIGDSFLQLLLGDKATDFTNAIAADKQMSKVATNRLISIVAPVIAGFLGKKVKRDNWSMPTLLKNIEAEKDQFVNWIPMDLKKSFGIFVPPGQEDHNVEKQSKKNNSWIMWLVLIILLLLLIFWWRSCRNRTADGYVEPQRATTITPARTDNTAVVNDTRTTTNDTTANRTLSNNQTGPLVQLGNGNQLQQAYAGSAEDQIVRFLESDRYKNASNDDLKDIWFDLDKVRFEFGSTSQLKDGYQAQVKNIESILKYYEDAKIDIGGFADRRGPEDVNLEISKERAEAFESVLENAGLGSQLARTRGFGNEYAKQLASAPDSVRAKDRYIALRFVK